MVHDHIDDDVCAGCLETVITTDNIVNVDVLSDCWSPGRNEAVTQVSFTVPSALSETHQNTVGRRVDGGKGQD